MLSTPLVRRQFKKTTVGGAVTALALRCSLSCRVHNGVDNIIRSVEDIQTLIAGVVEKRYFTVACQQRQMKATGVRPLVAGGGVRGRHPTPTASTLPTVRSMARRQGRHSRRNAAVFSPGMPFPLPDYYDAHDPRIAGGVRKANGDHALG